MNKILLNYIQEEPFKKQYTKRNTCYCGFEGLHEESIIGYTPHPSGWFVNGELYWLYVHCPKCHHEWSIWKLGVTRERY